MFFGLRVSDKWCVEYWQRMIVLVGYMLGGSRAPHSYSSSSRPARHQQPGFIPRQQYPAAASTSYPAAHGAQNFSIYQFQHRAGPGPGPVSPGPGWPLPGGLPADYSYPQNFFPAGIPLHSVDAIDNNRGRSKERKSSKVCVKLFLISLFNFSKLPKLGTAVSLTWTEKNAVCCYILISFIHKHFLIYCNHKQNNNQSWV